MPCEPSSISPNVRPERSRFARAGGTDEGDLRVVRSLRRQQEKSSVAVAELRDALDRRQQLCDGDRFVEEQVWQIPEESRAP